MDTLAATLPEAIDFAAQQLKDARDGRDQWAPRYPSPTHPPPGPGVFGVVGRLVRVSDRRVGRVLAWQLGPRIGTVLCTSRNDVDLRRVGLVLPKNHLRPCPQRRPWWSRAEFPTARFALDEICIASPSEDVLRRYHLPALLGPTIIVDTLDEAGRLRERMAASRDVPLSNILSLDGHKVSASGLMGRRNAMPDDYNSTLGSR